MKYIDCNKLQSNITLLIENHDIKENKKEEDKEGIYGNINNINNINITLKIYF